MVVVAVGADFCDTAAEGRFEEGREVGNEGKEVEEMVGSEEEEEATG